MTGASATKAVLYARFSSELQNVRSIDDQFALCRTYAEREGFTVTKTYADRAKTGASLFDRTALFDLMTDAKARHFDVVVVESLDRLSRDQEDLAGLFKRLQFAGIEIRTVNEGTATAIHVGLRGLVGQMFLKDLGDKVRRGHAGRVREGRIPGKVAYGYRAVPGKPGERTLHPEEAATILRIFSEYAGGKSPKAIADDLNAEGILGHRGKPWQWPRLTGGPRALLTNRIYLGEIHWNNWRNARDPETGRITKRPTPAEERMVVRAEHLRIVPDDLFEQAQAVRTARGRKQNIRPGDQRRAWQRNDSLLAGLVRCEVCGGSMVRGQGDRGGRPRLVCSAAKVGACTHRKSYDERKIQAYFIEGLKALTTSKRVIEAYVAEHSKTARKERDSARSEIGNIKRRLGQIEASMMRLVGFLERGDMAEDLIASRLQKLEAERAALRERERLTYEMVAEVDFESLALERFEGMVAMWDQVWPLVDDLARGHPEIRESRRIVLQELRNFIDHIDVRPTPKRADYEIAIHARAAALLGIDLNPPRRTPQQIVADHGSACSFSNNFDLSKYE
jgi:DNA invertase Pin-like site-specific DNA recombinase